MATLCGIQGKEQWWLHCIYLQIEREKSREREREISKQFLSFLSLQRLCMINRRYAPRQRENNIDWLTNSSLLHHLVSIIFGSYSLCLFHSVVLQQSSDVQLQQSATHAIVVKYCLIGRAIPMILQNFAKCCRSFFGGRIMGKVQLNRFRMIFFFDIWQFYTYDIKPHQLGKILPQIVEYIVHPGCNAVILHIYICSSSLRLCNTESETAKLSHIR